MSSNRAATLLPLLAACAHGPTIEDALVVSVTAWDALDEQVTVGIKRKSAAIELWREQAKCDSIDPIEPDCTRATVAGKNLADFVARWDALSLTIDVVLAIWKGDDPRKVILDVAPEVIDRVLSTVKGREAEAVREALAEARRIAREEPKT